MEKLEKYNYIGPKNEREQEEIDYLKKIEKYSSTIKTGPTLENYAHFYEAVTELLEINIEEFDDSLSKGTELVEIKSLKRFISALENKKNPFDKKGYLDGVPNFFKWKK